MGARCSDGADSKEERNCPLKDRRPCGLSFSGSFVEDVTVQSPEILKRNQEFRRVYQQSQVVRGAHLVLYLKKKPRPGARVGFSPGRKMKGACRRNRIKRRLRALMRLYAPGLRPPYELILLGRESAETVPFSLLKADFERAARRLKIWSGPEMAAEISGERIPNLSRDSGIRTAEDAEMH